MDLSSIIILLTGLGLGLAHSIDVDHIVAVSTLVCNNKSLRKCVTSAVVWGIGHSAILFVVGAALLLLKIVIPEAVITTFEFIAAFILILLGGFVLRPLIVDRFFRKRKPESHVHSHSHTHAHTHPHSHPHDHTHDSEGHTHLHKSALTGVLQGLGGSAAIMLVTVTTVSTVELGLIFILIFGIGVIVGMVGVSLLVGSVITYTAANLVRVNTLIKAITGTMSIAIGAYIIFSLVVGA